MERVAERRRQGGMVVEGKMKKLLLLEVVGDRTSRGGNGLGGKGQFFMKKGRKDDG